LLSSFRLKMGALHELLSTFPGVFVYGDRTHLHIEILLCGRTAKPNPVLSTGSDAGNATDANPAETDNPTVAHR
jgi:hypothetical protein